MTARNRLPDRRPSVSISFDFGEPGRETEFQATIGVDPTTGEPQEIFWSGSRVGSTLDALLGDMATGISVALQHGVPLDALRSAMSRAGDFEAAPSTAPRASAMGVALDLMAEIDTSRKREQESAQPVETDMNSNER